ncbi:adenylosuccinate synthase [Oligoflexaceae bacterium]|nr:adenylosuccinate synthase [Oligoflexaceae bacterium]
MPNVSIVVGAQWGDEGKGKWVDIFARQSDLVVRFQGGNNAGHTLFIDGKKIVLHQIPSGIFHKNTKAALAAGVVVNPVQLVEELEGVQKTADLSPERLWLSARAQVITPWHIHLDSKKEAGSDAPIGTTKRGIGPTYAEKASRTGIRLGHYVNAGRRRDWIQTMEKHNSEFAEHIKSHAAEWELFHNAAEKIGPYVTDAEGQIRKAIAAGQRVLMEGAQGALLDIDHGTFPFVTSSSTMAGGALASIGFSAKKVSNVYGIAKAYVTRVGEGPFPSELFDEDGEKLAKEGHEFGATTGRPRRCGWLDAVALKYSYHANGCDGLILNKMDILDHFDEIKICVAYEHPEQGTLTEFPWDPYTAAECKPVYETLKGWKSTLPKRGHFSDLAPNALQYVKRVEELIDGHVVMIGTGVNRENAIFKS